MKRLALQLLVLTPVVYITTARFVGAQSGEYFVNLFDEIGSIIDTAVPVLVALALALFLWGLVVFMTKAGEDQDKGKQHMLWGIIILFVAVSVWGIVQILQVIFGADGDIGGIGAPDIPS